MSTLVTFPRLSLQAALAAHLRALGTMDTETLRYPHAPSVDTVEPLCEAVRAAEAMADVLEAVEWEGPAVTGPWSVAYSSCPSCGASEYTASHAQGCHLHAALVAAGRRG